MRLQVFVLSAALFAASAAPSVAGAASPIGTWNTPKHHGVVKILECGGGICGRIEAGDDVNRDPNFPDSKNADPNLRTRKLKGVLIFENLKGGPTEWNGKVYNPEDGKTYTGSLTVVDADTVKLTGCVFKPFCKTEEWKRAK